MCIETHTSTILCDMQAFKEFNAALHLKLKTPEAVHINLLTELKMQTAAQCISVLLMF